MISRRLFGITVIAAHFFLLAIVNADETGDVDLKLLVVNDDDLNTDYIDEYILEYCAAVTDTKSPRSAESSWLQNLEGFNSDVYQDLLVMTSSLLDNGDVTDDELAAAAAECAEAIKTIQDNP
jgi:hypothetical protein